MKKHIYFVSYHYTGERSSGFGNVEMTINLPITRFDDIENIVKWIRQDVTEKLNQKVEIVILNYQFLRLEE